MKIKPIYLLPVFLIFLIALAWSNYNATKTKWKDSITKLERCVRLKNDIQKLNSDLNQHLCISTSGFDYSRAFNDKLSMAGISSTTTPSESTNMQDLQDLKIEMRQFDTNFATLSLEELARLLLSTSQSNNDMFVEKVEISAPQESQRKANEKWSARINWIYFESK